MTDCCSETDPSLQTLNQAITHILQAITPISSSISVPLRDALNRTLAKAVHSTIDVPSFTNSAMDGYAIRQQDYTSDKLFHVVGTAFAGKPYDQEIFADECVRIMTGAVLPRGVDTIIMQENALRHRDTMTIEKPPLLAQHVRKAGEELRRGQAVLQPGIQLMPAHIGLLAGLGVAEVRVIRKLRVAFFSTGDELTPLGHPLVAGQIYDSNRYALHSLVTAFGADILDLGVLPDDREAIESAFKNAMCCADVLLTSGGVSVGEADYVKETLEKLGDVHFWKIAIKPGKPLAFGHLGKMVFFGLPGNPVSAMATFYEIVLPGLKRLSGLSENPRQRFKVRLTTVLTKTPGRLEFQRGVLSVNDSGETVVASAGQQGSHMMCAMAQANCFIVLPQESCGANIGEMVEVEPLYGMLP